MPRKYAKRDPEFPVAEGLPSAADLDSVSAEALAKDATAQKIQFAPPPPNPAAMALQADIVTLVRQRSQVRSRIMEANSVLFKAQAEFQAAQSEMKALEEEVNYLHSQVAQLEGRQQIDLSQSFRALPLETQGSGFSVSSEPTMSASVQMNARAAEAINRGHATREMY